MLQCEVSSDNLDIEPTHHQHCRLTSYAPRTRARFTPKHWLLCHLGLYY